MSKLVVLFALFAVAAARPSLLETPYTYSAPNAAITIQESDFAHVGNIVKSVPSAISHHSNSVVHSTTHVAEDILAPAVKTTSYITKTLAAPVIKRYQYAIAAEPTATAAVVAAPALKTYAAASPLIHTYAPITTYIDASPYTYK